MSTMMNAFQRRQTRRAMLAELQEQLSQLQETQACMIDDLQSAQMSADQLAHQVHDFSEQTSQALERLATIKNNQTVYSLPPVKVETLLLEQQSEQQQQQSDSPLFQRTTTRSISLSPKQGNTPALSNEDTSPLPSVSVMMDPILFMKSTKRTREDTCSMTLESTLYDDEYDHCSYSIPHAGSSDDIININDSTTLEEESHSEGDSQAASYHSRKRRREQDSTVRKKWRRMHRDHRLKSIMLD